MIVFGVFSMFFDEERIGIIQKVVEMKWGGIEKCKRVGCKRVFAVNLMEMNSDNTELICVLIVVH